MFDKDALLNASVDGSMSTRVKPIPEADYLAVVDSIEVREVNVKPKGGKPGGVVPSLDIQLKIDDPQLAAELGREPKVYYSTFLDLDASGRLDLSEGKNVRLGRLRDALGQNQPGQPWSPLQMKGQPVRIQTVNTPADDGSENVYTNIKAFARVG